MSKVILDDKLWEQLKDPGEHAELCNPSGQTVGYFVSPDVYKQLMYAWAKQQFTREELERARQETGGLTTAELLAHLEAAGHRGGGA